MRNTHIVFISFILICLSSIADGQSRDLDYYISRGMANSPLLNDIRNQASSSTIDSLIVTAGRKPQVEGRSQLLYSPYGNNFGYDEVITDGGNYQAVAYVSQDIFVGRKTANKYQAISNEKKALNLTEKLTAAELRKSITDIYLESFSAYSELQFNISFLNLLKEEGLVVKRLAENGSSSQADYLSLLVETGGQEVIISQMRSQYRKDIMAMNELCGIVDTSWVSLSGPVIKASEITGSHDFLFLKQYFIDSLRLINDKEALALRYKPAVNWFADAGILTSNPLTFYRHAGASAGLSLSVPIYDGHQRKLEEEKLSIRENTRVTYLDVSRKQYDQTLLRLNDELDGLGRIRTSLEKQLKLSEELMNSLRVQMENGIVRMQDYIPAVKNYRSIRHNIILSDIEMLRIKNEINYILSK
jgi:outer membrane protein TolC